MPSRQSLYNTLCRDRAVAIDAPKSPSSGDKFQRVANRSRGDAWRCRPRTEIASWKKQETLCFISFEDSFYISNYSQWIEQFLPLWSLLIDESTETSERRSLCRREGTLSSFGLLVLPFTIVIVDEMCERWIITNENPVVLPHVREQDVGVVVLRHEHHLFLFEHRFQIAQLLVTLWNYYHTTNQFDEISKSSGSLSSSHTARVSKFHYRANQIKLNENRISNCECIHNNVRIRQGRSSFLQHNDVVECLISLRLPPRPHNYMHGISISVVSSLWTTTTTP